MVKPGDIIIANKVWGINDVVAEVSSVDSSPFLTVVIMEEPYYGEEATISYEEIKEIV